MNKELEFLEDKHGDNSWGCYPPSKREVAQWLQEFTEKQFAIHSVGWRSEQLPEFDVQEINEILQDCKEKKEDLLTLISRIWNKGYMTAVCDEREG